MEKAFILLLLFATSCTCCMCQSHTDSLYYEGGKKTLVDNPCQPFGHKVIHKRITKLDSIDTRKISNNTLIYLNQAKSAYYISDTIFNYLQVIKDVIASRSGGWTDSCESSIEDDKNLEISTQYFLQEGNGNILKSKLIAYKEKMTQLIPIGLIIPRTIHIDIYDPKSRDGDQKTWTEYYWEGVPTIAAITELTKFQQDVLQAEAYVINANLKLIK